MKTAEIRKKVVEVLKKTQQPLSFSQIADEINLTMDAYVLQAELNNLTQTGMIKTIYNPFGGNLYTY